MHNHHTIQPLIQLALAEDIGVGDITSIATIPADKHAKFSMNTREPINVAGMEYAVTAFHHIDPTIDINIHVKDGDQAAVGAMLLSGSGNARAILTAERVALNFLQHLSGIATLTRAYVDAVEGTNAVVLDTRKTTPLLRESEKYAVTQGGGENHRMRLDDMVLIKDNHIAVSGGITEAIRQARAAAPKLLIECECDTLAQVEEAIEAQADRIMLDNMSLDQLRQAVAMSTGRIPLEASGNVNLDTIVDIARTGVDYISVGRITHSAPNVDIGLDIVV